MSYNILKTMTDSKTGKKTCVLLLDGLESILEVKELDQALNMAAIFNQNTDSGWLYEVRKGGITYKFEDFKTIKNN
jgi:hypothetical protein